GPSGGRGAPAPDPARAPGRAHRRLRLRAPRAPLQWQLALGTRQRAGGGLERRRPPAADDRHAYPDRRAEAAGGTAAWATGPAGRDPAPGRDHLMVLEPGHRHRRLAPRVLSPAGPPATRPRRRPRLAEAPAARGLGRAAPGLAADAPRRPAGAVRARAGRCPGPAAVPAGLGASPAGRLRPHRARAWPVPGRDRPAPRRRAAALAHRTAGPRLRAGPHRRLRDRAVDPPRAVDRRVLPHPRPAGGTADPGRRPCPVHPRLARRLRGGAGAAGRWRAGGAAGAVLLPARRPAGLGPGDPGAGTARGPA